MIAHLQVIPSYPAKFLLCKTFPKDNAGHYHLLEHTPAAPAVEKGLT